MCVIVSVSECEPVSKVAPPPMVGVESSRQVSMLFSAFYMDTNERSFGAFIIPGENRVAKRGEVGKVAARWQSRCWRFFFWSKSA